MNTGTMEQVAEKDERYWLEAFRAGEDAALAHFFERHYKPLCYFASRLLQDGQEAEDIVADCFVKLWNGPREVQNAENIKAFLYISCRNACFNHLKRMKVRTQVQDVYYRELEGAEESVLSRIIQSEVLDLLVGEIELLPEQCREVFKMLYFEQKKTDEIAALMGISVVTVRRHKTRAVELLKASVLKKGISGSLYLALLFFLDSHFN